MPKHIDPAFGDYTGMTFNSNGTFAYGDYLDNLLDYQETGRWRLSSVNIWPGFDGRISIYLDDGSVEHYQYKWQVRGRAFYMEWEQGLGDYDDN